MVEEKTPVNEPCPFCGSQGKSDTLNYASGKPGKYRIQCQDCGGATRWYETAEEAWQAWNKRYVKPSPELEVFVFNQDAFVYEARLYIRNKESGYCFTQKEFRGDLKRISKKDFLLAANAASNAQAERTNAEYGKTGKVKE
jgi:Lar family restriction alleviation protein